MEGEEGVAMGWYLRYRHPGNMEVRKMEGCRR